MKTEVVMKREIFGTTISQKSKTEMFSATDLVRAGNRWRISQGMEPFLMSKWFQLKSTKEFMEELKEEFGKIKISGRGRGKHTWIHPLLFIDMALSISPKLKVETYKWLLDNLLMYRNNSGESYKKMSGALFCNSNSKQLFYKEIQEVAREIKARCGVDNWENATERQLILRDKIHENISLLSSVLKNNDEAVRIGIIQAKKG